MKYCRVGRLVVEVRFVTFIYNMVHTDDMVSWAAKLIDSLPAIFSYWANLNILNGCSICVLVKLVLATFHLINKYTIRTVHSARYRPMFVVKMRPCVPCSKMWRCIFMLVAWTLPFSIARLFGELIFTHKYYDRSRIFRWNRKMLKPQWKHAPTVVIKTLFELFSKNEWMPHTVAMATAHMAIPQCA